MSNQASKLSFTFLKVTTLRFLIPLSNVILDGSYISFSGKQHDISFSGRQNLQILATQLQYDEYSLVASMYRFAVITKT